MFSREKRKLLSLVVPFNDQKKSLIFIMKLLLYLEYKIIHKNKKIVTQSKVTLFYGHISCLSLGQLSFLSVVQIAHFSSNFPTVLDTNKTKIQTHNWHISTDIIKCRLLFGCLYIGRPIMPWQLNWIQWWMNVQLKRRFLDIFQRKTV